MADKKRESEFTVSDRRRFSFEGETQPDTAEEKPEERPEPTGPSASPAEPETPGLDANPAPPTAAEQQAQHDAFKQSTRELDEQLKTATGRPVQDFEMNFERFIASLYMTALMQLGLVHEQGAQPRVDLLGARQTIDTLVILRDKTKGNLTTNEQNLL